MKTAEILYFIRLAAEEKQERENYLTRKEWSDVDDMLRNLEELVEFAMRHKDDKY